MKYAVVSLCRVTGRRGARAFQQLSCSAVFSISAVAAAESPLIELNNLVVSAAGFEQKVADAPASVTVIERKHLQAKPYHGLAEALRDVEGVDIGSGTDKNGNVSIALRGLPPEYTLILIDGRRQSDVGDIGPNNFGNSQFMYMPPLSAIERIEVVRGPMSTLYGADAIGGVINIITRKVADKWSGSFGSSLTVQESSQYGNDRKTEFHVSGPLVKDLVGLSLRGSLYDREASDPGYVGERLPLPPTDVNGDPNVPAYYEDTGSFGDRKVVAAQNWNSGVTIGLTPHENHDFSIEYDIAKQRYDNTLGQTGTLDGPESLWRASNAGIVQPRVGYSAYQRVEREQIVLTHSGRWDAGSSETSITHLESTNLGRSLPLTVAERQAVQQIWDAHCPTVADCKSGSDFVIPFDAVYDRLEAEFLPRQRRELTVRSTIFDTKFDTQIGAHTLSLGGQYIDAEMEDGVFGMYGSGYLAGTVQPHRQWALFAEDHWSLGNDLTVTGGVRLDEHNVFGSNTSPRVYLNWRSAENWTFKGGISTGYKPPKPNQLFAGITGFGGQGVSPFVGTPDLQPETSINYELAGYYDSLEGFSANLTLFHNKFDDKIARADGIPNCYNIQGERHLDSGCADIGPGWAEFGYTEFSQTINVDEAVTMGAELGFKMVLADTWSLRGNYTYTDSEQKSGAGAGLPLVNTPEHMANATLDWQVAQQLRLSLVSEYRGKRFRYIANAAGPGEGDALSDYYKAYGLLHLGAHYQASESLSFNARINNLLDDNLSSRSCAINDELNGYSCTADYNTTEKARSFWLSASVTF